jgi:hypothetical protein
LSALPSTVCWQATGSAPAICVFAAKDERNASDAKRALERENSFKDRLLLRLASEIQG